MVAGGRAGCGVGRIGALPDQFDYDPSADVGAWVYSVGYRVGAGVAATQMALGGGRPAVGGRVGAIVAWAGGRQRGFA